MQHAEFKARTRRWNQFSQVDTLGSFDFYTSLISLDALTSNDISALRVAFSAGDKRSIESLKNLTPDQYNCLAKVLPLAVHEYTHFIDATSTVWGLRHLALMNEAYMSDDKRGGTEETFFKAMQFYDHVRKIRLPDYYTVVVPNQLNLRPWQSSITMGRRFSRDGTISKKSVLFSRFANYKGDVLARSPISTVSLLEASAMAQEVLSHAVLINNSEKDFRLVEMADFTSRTLNYIYNPQITEYSVCVHVLANILGCKDILVAFRICAAITRIVLNFPKSAFRSVAKSCPVHDILKIQKGHEFESRIFDGIEHEDLGVLFYLLCNALPKESHETEDATKSGIRAAIKAIGIDYETLTQEAAAEVGELFSAMKSSSIDPILKLSQAGLENFERIELDQKSLPFHRLNLPPVLLGDSTQMDIFPTPDNSLIGFDLDACFDTLYQGQSWVERFSEACI